MFLVHLDHQARSLSVDVYPGKRRQVHGQGIDDDYLPSEQYGGELLRLFPWDGNVTKGNSTHPAAADGDVLLQDDGDQGAGQRRQRRRPGQSPNFMIDRP